MIKTVHVNSEQCMKVVNIHFGRFLPNIFDIHKLKSSPSSQKSPLKYKLLKNSIIDDLYTTMVEFVVKNPTIHAKELFGLNSGDGFSL